MVKPQSSNRKVLTVRMTADQYATVKQAAWERKLSIEEYVRRCVLPGAGPPKPVVVLPVALPPVAPAERRAAFGVPPAMGGAAA